MCKLQQKIRCVSGFFVIKLCRYGFFKVKATAKVIAMVKTVLVRKFVIVLITVTAVRDCMARASFVVILMSKSYGLG